jgi:hypothetical protein
MDYIIPKIGVNNMSNNPDFYTGFKLFQPVCHVAEVPLSEVSEVFEQFSVLVEAGDFIIYTRINESDLYFHGTFKTRDQAFEFGSNKLGVTKYFSGLGEVPVLINV